MCLLQGVSYNNTYYYPHHPHSQFKANNLPLRTRVRRCIKDVIATHCSETEKEWGIVSESIFLELNSVHFPRSFPIDLMHCILQNITPMLYSLWNGSKLSIDRSSTYEDQNAGDWPPYNIGKPASILETLGNALESSRNTIPSSLGHAPRRIDRHHAGFKASEWAAWLTMYGNPLITNLLDDIYVDNFRILSQLYILATQTMLDETDIAQVGHLAIAFVESYERIYYRGQHERLPTLTVNLHYLLHLEQHLRDCGPGWAFWQFPMERFAGVVKPLAKSKSQLSYSLSNSLMMIEHLNHYHFVRGRSGKENPQYPQLLTPCTGRLYQTAWDLINTHFQTLSNAIQQVIHHGMISSYLRCQLRSDLVIGSEIQLRTELNRVNYVICYTEGDHYGATVRFANVKLFIEVEGIGKWALVSGSRDVPTIDPVVRLAYYDRRNSREEKWIQVSDIKSVVGELKGLRSDNIVYCVTDYGLYD